jgi:hypothetical protein
MTTLREKLLAAVVLGLLLVWGGGKLWGRYNEAVATKRSELVAARQRLDDAKFALEKGRLATLQLERWQTRSLPADREVAQSAYRVWLETGFKQAGLTIDDIQPSQRLAPAAGYSAIGCTVTARGSLKSLTAFLREFYRSALLQQITRLQLRPASDPKLLGITLQTEALVLAGTASEGLPAELVDRPQRPTAAEYADSIGGRNLFAVYTPPRPVPPPGVARTAPPKPEFDDAKFAYFTATIQVDGRYQAWIHVRTTNETLRLFAGDAVKVGLFDGKIVSIEPRSMVVKCNEEELRVELGHNLREGKTDAKTNEG